MIISLYMFYIFFLISCSKPGQPELWATCSSESVHVHGNCGWHWMLFKAPSSPRYSMILWFRDFSPDRITSCAIPHSLPIILERKWNPEKVAFLRETIKELLKMVLIWLKNSNLVQKHFISFSETTSFLSLVVRSWVEQSTCTYAENTKGRFTAFVLLWRLFSGPLKKLNLFLSSKYTFAL